MRREVVQDFLNLPGVTGIALMDGRSRPYFYGVDQALNFQQREALAQGIQQVIETTPPGFQFFEFQFIAYQIYIYKLEHGIILLVLTGKNLASQTYTQLIEQLKAELSEDTASAIATFRLLAGNLTLSDPSYWKDRSEPPTILDRPSGSQVSPTSEGLTTNNGGRSRPPSGAQPPLVQESAVPPLTPTSFKESKEALDETKALPQVNLKELLAALNQLSQFTTQYLGTTVITNYWKMTRPPVDWLNNFQVDRSAHFTFSEVLPSGNPQQLTPDEHRCVQEWITAFIVRCSKVIRDFPLIIEQRALDDQQRNILLKK